MSYNTEYTQLFLRRDYERKHKRRFKSIRSVRDLVSLCRILLNRPVSEMNPGKQEEVSERKLMDIGNDTP